MKMVLYFVFFLFSVHILFSQTIPLIDVSKNYQNAAIKLQDIADIEYVPLETNRNVLLDGDCRFPYISNNYIVASNVRQGDIFLFGRNGKIKYKFNHRGNGPHDYLDTRTIVFDEKNSEVFIFVQKAPNPVFLVYSEDGTYMRTIQCPQFTNNANMIIAKNFDDNNLLIYDAAVYGNHYAKNPYMLLSKKDGTVTSLNISLPKRYQYFVHFPDGELFFYCTPFVGSDGQDLIIADISCDTIFQLKRDKSLTPLLIRTPSVHRTEPKIYITAVFKTEKFMLLRRVKMPPQGSKTGSENSALIYNFSNGTINQIRDFRFFNNTDDIANGTHNIRPEATLPQNTLLFRIQAAFLYEYRDELTGGELKKIASTIDEEDNPVLLIAKFR